MLDKKKYNTKISSVLDLDQIIIVKPYLQPGKKTHPSNESRVIIWQTHEVNALYSIKLIKLQGGQTTEIPYTYKRIHLNSIARLYKAELLNLEPHTQYSYEFFIDGQLNQKESFHTLANPSQVQFAAFGCGSEGTIFQQQIANLMNKSDFDFVMHLGDFTYPSCSMSGFVKNAFPYYQKLMAKYPFYLTYGNHDLGDNREENLDQNDLAAFYYFDLPQNGPIFDSALDSKAPKGILHGYKNDMGRNFYERTNYSFQKGPAHILVLDGNTWINPLDSNFIDWIIEDLKNATAPWKIVAIHQPPFSAAIDFVSDKPEFQEPVADRDRSRKYVEIFQDLGVSLVLSAHVHAFERSRPIWYRNGEIIVDQKFDGINYTQQDGITYVISGASGAQLVTSALQDTPYSLPFEQWNELIQTTPFLAAYDFFNYSYSSIQVNTDQIQFQQIDKSGRIIDNLCISR